MALNSQFQGSIFSARNENTIGLLNANVEFSLVKVQIPTQFEGLSTALSPIRRENAERGPQHQTARRLGALFEQVIPNIDILATAYGERVSEIARSAEFDFQVNDYGPFARHVGVDGTSIIAAVSSGSSVIALHLLACMLARMFSSAEATAIWVQLVDFRLKEIEEKSDGSQIHGIAALYAAQHGRQILRTDLADWDASARAWLQAANQVKAREDTQMRLIIKNILSINSSGTTYSNVVNNWITAMTTIQKLIQGVPHDITNSAVFLGLVSWHIYPDLSVFSPNKFVQFNDRLVKPGGVITLGLEQQGENQTGVSWSISISHLRYYGDPIIIKKSSEEDSDRITPQELRFIGFGCVLASWAKPSQVSITEAAECFVALGDALKISNMVKFSYIDDLGWLIPLIDAAKQLLSATGERREAAMYFVEFGRRRGRKFLDEDCCNTIPMFGLVNPYLIFMQSTGFAENRKSTESSIATLRQFSSDCNFNPADCVIVSRPKWFPKSGDSDFDDGIPGNWEMTSAIPTRRLTGKRSQDGEPVTTKRHTRWVHIDRTEDPLMQRYLDIPEANIGEKIRDFNFNEEDNINETPRDTLDFLRLGGSDATIHEFFGEESTSINSIPSCQCFTNKHACDQRCSCYERGFKCTPDCACIHDFDGFAASLRCKNSRSCTTASETIDEDCFWLSVRSISDMDYNSQLSGRGTMFNWIDPPNFYVDRQFALQNVNFQLFNTGENLEAGDSDRYDSWPFNTTSIDRRIKFHSIAANGTAGLFLSDLAKVDIPNFSLAKTTELLRSSAIDAAKLRQYMVDIQHTGLIDHSHSVPGQRHNYPLFSQSLKALSAISELYSDWPEATMSISITKRAMGTSQWASYLSKQTDDYISNRAWRSTKFACLAMLESGGHDIHPHQLDLVMAMATGNSIYASEALLQDPVLPDRSGSREFKGVRRIFGNLGYPGVVMLIPPPTPRILQLDQMQRAITQGAIFNGLAKNSFTETSLHLKFTEFKVPVASPPGAVDAEVIIREALISVYDGSKWIADLDVFGAFDNLNLYRFPICNCTSDDNKGSLCGLLTKDFESQLKTITSWDELLICKENLMEDEIGTVCAYGNWFARLAVSALVNQLGCQIFILPSHCMCCECGKKLLKMDVLNQKREVTKGLVLFVL